MKTGVIFDDRLLGKSHTDQLVHERPLSQQELDAQMNEVFKERVRLNREGHHHDIVRGC